MQARWRMTHQKNISASHYEMADASPEKAGTEQERLLDWDTISQATGNSMMLRGGYMPLRSSVSQTSVGRS